MPTTSVASRTVDTEIVFYDANGHPHIAELVPEADKAAPAELEVLKSSTSYGDDVGYVVADALSTEFKICKVPGVPDVKTEIVYRTYKVFGKTIRIPTVAIRHRTCTTEVVAIFRLADEKIKPLIVECAVPAAVIAAAIIIAGCVTVVGAPAAFAAGLEAFAQSVAACLALKGYQRNVFDVKLEQRKSCGAWH
jgi:hypothetical protein